MIDALYPLGIPPGTECDAIAAYIDHPANVSSYAQAVARFPDAIHVKISAHAPGTVGADVLDVEPGTYITPQHAVAWVVASRTRGIDPTVYCNQLAPSWGWTSCKAAFAAAKVPEPHWWVANYDGDPTIPAGAAAKQYTDLDQNGRNTYDTSATAPGWMEDDMPTVDEIVAAVHKDVASMLADPYHAYLPPVEHKLDALAAAVAGVAAQVAAMQAANSGMTPDQVTSAAKAGAEQALAGYALTLTPPAAGSDLNKAAQ